MNLGDANPALACVYSLPRSGSTVLIAELDRLKGIVCLPESYFPQVLEFLTPQELSDPAKLAAFFLASSPSGSLISFEEAQTCMVPDDWKATLVRLGLACAAKTNRNPSQVRTIIWKTTRIIGKGKLFAEAGGRFLVLRRNPVNVFDSQFRVSFGRHNRNPLRFAVFLESYEAAFSRLPPEATYHIEYEAIPEQLAAMSDWFGVVGDNWAGGESSIALTHARKTWHNGLMDGFQSRDEIKRKNVTLGQRFFLGAGRFAAKPVRPILSFLRDYYDGEIIKQIRNEATTILVARSH